ncbi:hypothetical protein ACFVGM_38650 [Kitasatospora purpeofusca]|uniref:hypothetical protein n=1 Tax=Kitasatospora purpeofusca TaxID=67352 RepID=UPI00368A21A9
MRTGHLKSVGVFAAAGSLLAFAPATATAATARTPQHCTVSVEGGDMRCFDTYRQAIAAATGGLVADAPLDVETAMADPSFADRIDRAGETVGARAGDARPGEARPGATAAAAAVVLSTEYEHGNFGGASLSVTGPSACGSARWQLALGADWNDRISSYKTFNNCQVRHWEHTDFSGANTGYQVGDQDWIGDLNDRASSIDFTYGDSPTTAQLLKDCGKATESCDFRPTGNASYSYGGAHEVARGYNCSSVAQTRKMTWTEQTSGENSVSTEISVTAGFDFLEKFEVTFKASYGHKWAWADTFAEETTLQVPAGQVGWVDRNTHLQSAAGTYELHYKSKHWGHYVWYVKNFSGTGPVPQEAGVVTWNTRKMTTAEKNAQCKGRAAFVMADPGAEGAAAPAVAATARSAATVSSGR